jgi:hypothetical protein
MTLRLIATLEGYLRAGAVSRASYCPDCNETS